MLPSDRNRLHERLATLREARERKARVATIQAQIDMLQNAGVSFEIVLQPRTTWLEKAFPWTGGLASRRIDWAQVPIRAEASFSASGEMDERAWLGQLSAQHRLVDHPVTVLPENGLEPAILLRFADLKICPQVVSSLGRAWVICEAGHWAIEYGFDDPAWYWGRAVT